MTEEATNARISRLEDDVAEVRKDRREDIKSLHEKMDAVIATVATISKGQGMEDVRIHGELEAVKARMCPKPGACVDLSSRVSKLEDHCTAIHDMMQQMKGGGKVIAGIYGAIGASVLSGIVWLVTHFITTGKP